ncbi:Protein translocase subunit SecD [Methanimicrococcus hongohii]|uniref:Protein-export membrane protein SecD n=1 Tax=Methanimicrococcus hongohii TaxID=3028295 RepID=A0AA96ZTV1_9EURY|nr:preprotein translocase subunit SecD [Methanimicrococcus sp. Hf6]WNY23616.1 Protein translocase subunit SecD [Methanimicrococcus sp. Hf6]
MMEEKKEQPLYKDPKVILLGVALLVALIAIFSPIGYFAEDDGITNIHFGLDIKGGSTIYLKLNGAVAQVDAAPRDIVMNMTAADFPNSIEITGTSVKDDGSAYVAFRTSDPVNKTKLEYMFRNSDVYVSTSASTSGSTALNSSNSSSSNSSSSNSSSSNSNSNDSDSTDSGNAPVSQVNITSTQIGFITSYLAHVYGAEVVAYPTGTGGVEYEIRTSTTREELDGYMQAVSGRILTDNSGDPIYKDGTTKTTMQTTIDVLNSKLGNGLGVKDLPIRAVGDEYIQIDFAGVDLADARELVSSPGKFEIRIQITGNETAHVLYGDAIESVGVVGNDPSTGVYYVPFTLNEDGAKALQLVAINTGATVNPNAHHLIMMLDEEVVYSAPLSSSAANQLNSNPIYSWQAGTSSQEEARTLQIHLRAGALPVNVEIVNAGQVDAALGQGFLRGAILAGILALFAVALIIYNRYKRLEIALPMIATSFSEVILLVGFSVLIMQDLDLAAIAGIIAVIGTGIDHLVIITEEVVHEGKTPSDTVYTKRIGKAFMIIFGAAATTVVAMLPLISSLGFGTLKGFAIVTIAGVLIGVLIARPAYSAILRYILTKRGAIDEKMIDE